MRYGQIRNYDIANGPGIRISIFVTGCTHRCKGCFNELYMDFNYGNLWTDVQTDLIVKCLDDISISGLTVLGGEPMQNTDGLIPVLTKIRESIGRTEKKTIWIYSGYTFEEIMRDEQKVRLLSLCDVLVDGRFVEELKNPRLKFRGSENQRVIDIPESLRTGSAVLLPGYELEAGHKIKFILQKTQAQAESAGTISTKTPQTKTVSTKIGSYR